MTREATFINVADEPSEPFEFLLSVTRRHGDAVRYAGQVGPTYLFNDPDDARTILQNPRFERTSLVTLVIGESLLSSDGEYWKQQRQRAHPFFTQSTVARFAPLIQAQTREVLAQWAELSASGQRVDVAGEMTRLTASIIVEALFAVRLGPRIDDLCAALDVLLNDLGEMACSQLNTPLTFTPSSRARFQGALAILDRVIADIIDERRRAPDDPTNYLSFLLSVKDAAGTLLSPTQVRDEVAAMLIAGHETTAIALSWAWYLLGRHPAVEHQLHEELDRVLGTRTPGFEDLPNLPFTTMVLQESMRLYPPVWIIARKSIGMNTVRDCPVEPGSVVLVSPYTLHRHPAWWHEPEAFNPSRFAPDVQRHKGAYIPFAGGRHLCIGMHLALIEGPLILASLAQNYLVRPIPDHPVELQPAVTLRPRHGVLASLTRRVPVESAR